MIRVARPSDDLDALLPFYRDGLGMRVIARFEDHDGFDGVIVGLPGCPCQLEFTRSRRHAAGTAPTRDHLLVLYLPDPDVWRAAVGRMCDAGFAPVPSCNPCWDRVGRTFEDPDGYRVVLQNAAS